MSKDYDAELDGWEIIQNYEGKIVLAGKISNDSRNRFDDGDRVVTSEVKLLNMNDMIAVTKNTVYKLNTPIQLIGK